jgi:hypothetical protein
MSERSASIAGLFPHTAAEVSLTRHIFLRAEYCGFVSPTYDLTQVAGLDRVSHRAEPTIGFRYRF